MEQATEGKHISPTQSLLDMILLRGGIPGLSLAIIALVIGVAFSSIWIIATVGSAIATIALAFVALIIIARLTAIIYQGFRGKLEEFSETIGYVTAIALSFALLLFLGVLGSMLSESGRIGNYHYIAVIVEILVLGWQFRRILATPKKP